jgi:hypothetical protein
MELADQTPTRAPPMMKQMMAAMKKPMGHHLFRREGWPGDDMIEDELFLVGAGFFFISRAKRERERKTRV